ncbi:MAG TPA: PIN domain-containing protein [Bryobacteraceae bacterium]|nr:PIN domain-containing protein [Bryobacteraceae bacterium]
MILVDTSVWVNHFRRADTRLNALLDQELVLLHPFVLGELVCANLARRPLTIAALRLLPHAAMAPETDVHRLLDARRLWGLGLGWIDLHLLAAALIGGDHLWTSDRALAVAANRANIQFTPG